MTPVSKLLRCLALLCLMPALVYALPEDRNQPIEIEADRAERNERDGSTIYVGNVVLTQGSLLLKAERLEIYNRDNQVERIVGTGEPAYIEQQNEPGQPPVKARGNTIYYYVMEEKIRLIENASLEQDGSTVHSEQIDYSIREELATADGEGRVKVVIPPQPDIPEADNNATDSNEVGNSEAPVNEEAAAPQGEQ